MRPAPPPVPEGVASAELDRIKPAPNQPSPQAGVVSAPAGATNRDEQLARTSFDVEPAPIAPPADFRPVDDQSSLVTKVLKALASPDAATRQAACQVLRAIGTAAMPTPGRG